MAFVVNTICFCRQHHFLFDSPNFSFDLNYQRMRTSRVPKTLRDVGCFETMMTTLQTGVKDAHSSCVGKDVLEEKVWELNDRISHLEQRLDAEMKGLAARCERLESELAHFRETPKREETNGKEIVPRQPPPQDPALSMAFSGNDLEIMSKGVEALKEWTGKARVTIVYDSTKDPFTHDELFDKVKGKVDIAVVGFTSDGDVFGGFYSVAVTEQDKKFFDPNLFIFSFESHGRCETPQRFVVNEEWKEKAGVEFCKVDVFGWFVVFQGGGLFHFGNEKSITYCHKLSRGFVGIEDTTLTGNNGSAFEGPYHLCTRLVAIQLE